MKIPLESLTPCFQGLIPAWLYTCSKDGIPNVAVLSDVDYVDSRHVALSFQFFNKSKRNIAENPQALVRIYDPDSLQAYALRLRYVRSETEGPLFETMRLRIESIASHTGLKGIFKLLAADIYEVLSVTPAEDEAGSPTALAAGKRAAARPAAVPFTMKALQELSERIHRAPTLECLLESTLETIESLFAFEHSMILLAGEQPERVVTLASRGYPERGVGSEVGFGEGIIGMVAEARKPIRISGLLRQFLYAYAVAKSAQERGLCPEDRRIPLPGLPNPESQLGIPLLVRDELLGVLCIESTTPYRFHEEDRAYLEVLGGYVAIAIQNAILRERTEEAEETEPPRPPGREAARHPERGAAERATRVATRQPDRGVSEREGTRPAEQGAAPLAGRDVVSRATRGDTGPSASIRPVGRPAERGDTRVAGRVETRHTERGMAEGEVRRLEELRAAQPAAQREARDNETTSTSRPRPATPSPGPAPAPAGRRSRIEVAYYRIDECILVDGEYLVRSLPAKILWKLLTENRDTGRSEFTNRLLRLDKTLSLPEFKDNLESRLILLRRRLEERCPEIRIVPSGRGRFTLDLACEPSLVERP